ncbi:hypothetical protein TNCV_1769791 [Trichonephila clavipes]|nr:hypothetical protein TNCV_1769791 [Trichonephila clavipes]
MTPVEASLKENSDKVYRNLYKEKVKHKPKFQVEDKIRISIHKSTFRRGGEMCPLVYVCENLTPVLEYLGNDPSRLLADVRRFFLACLDKMYDIVFREENDDLREQGLEDLDEVLSILDTLV